MVKYFSKNFVINFLIILSIFSIDRFTKIYVIFQNEKNLFSELFVSKYLNISLIWNEGIAFGLFSFNDKIFYQFITMVILIIIIVLIFLVSKKNGFEKFGYIMVIGGALGNLFDRIYYNRVPDFIDFHINNFHWFIFNIADIFITIGVINLICVEIFKKKND